MAASAITVSLGDLCSGCGGDTVDVELERAAEGAAQGAALVAVVVAAACPGARARSLSEGELIESLASNSRLELREAGVVLVTWIRPEGAGGWWLNAGSPSAAPTAATGAAGDRGDGCPPAAVGALAGDAAGGPAMAGDCALASLALASSRRCLAIQVGLRPRCFSSPTRLSFAGWSSMRGVKDGT